MKEPTIQVRIPAGQPAEKHSGKVKVEQMNTRVTMKKVRSSLDIQVKKLACFKGSTRLLMKFTWVSKQMLISF